ncbi:MAG: HEAT repeat domain-containing protein [Bdellovibrionales bacterium]|nr:HEAT repeat domain-containing protein [Bdellovibrionales bacterium]
MSTKTSKKRILLALLFSLVGLAAYFFWSSSFNGSKMIRSNPALKKDYELLREENAGTSIDSVAMALRRLNSYRLPEGLTEALKRSNDPRPQIRSAVAEALSMNVLKEEVFDAESRLVLDPEESVRVASLTALTRIGDPRRTEIFDRAMANPGKSVREEFLIHSGLYMAAKGDEKGGHLKAIHSLLSRHKNDPDLVFFGLKTLLRISPDDAQSVEQIKVSFLDPKTTKELLPPLYRYLVRTRPEFLKKRFSKDAKSAFAPLRVTALNSILEVCPIERWSLIQSVLKDPVIDSQSKIIARRIAGSLGGKEDSKGMIQAPPPGTDRCENFGQYKSPRATTGKGR